VKIREFLNQINILSENKLIDIDKELLINNLEDNSCLEICGIAYYDYGGVDLQALKHEDENE
jgi:hypothetical protein